MLQILQVAARLNALVDTVRWIGARNWSPATGGNFSVRVDEQLIAVTKSGVDKTQLSLTDLMLVDLQGNAIEAGLRPSAEAVLHCAIYRQDANINCVLHGHSIAATCLSRLNQQNSLKLQGFEMQKALSGNHSHQPCIELSQWPNDQDMDALAQRVAADWARVSQQPGLIVQGHGVYAWGQDVAAARRHLEGIEFLLEAAVVERQLTR